MADKDNLSSELSRDLSLFHLTMMGMGMMIGAGVFLGIGNSIRIAGPGGALLTFALNACLALLTAMSYGELSSAIPRAGGAYNFARIGFGPGTSFIAGWMEWFASSVAGSMYAITFSIYLMRYLEQLELLNWLPGDAGTYLVKPVGILIAVLFVLINYRGASETGRVGAIITLGQTFFLVFIGVVGAIVAVRDPERLRNLQPFMPHGWDKLLVTMGFTYVAFEGFEVIAQAGDEAQHPRSNLPKAMIYSVFFVGITYVAVTFATLVSVKAGVDGVSAEPWRWIGSFGEKGFGAAVEKLIPAGNFFLTLAVIFASTSALNATVFSATRASYALGRDGMLPKIFSRLSKKRKTPAGALLITAGIILIFITALPTLHVASSASIMFLFLFFLVNVCVIKIRVSLGDELNYGFIMPLFPLFPILAIVLQAVLAVWLVHMSLIAWIVAPVWIAGGFAVYLFYSKTRATPSEFEVTVIEEEQAPEGDEYRVMIPIANPDNAISLVGNTIKLCRDRDARIKLLHMVSVPDLVNLTDGEQYLVDGREGIVEAMLYLIRRFPISTTIRYCRNTARGIISAAKEKKTDLLIAGWHGRAGNRLYRIGSTIDPLIARAPCRIVILKECQNRKFRRVLVPVFGNNNDQFAVETALRLAEPEGSEIHLMSVRSRGASLYSLNRLQNRYSGSDSGAKFSFDTGSGDIERSILSASENYDLVVLGISAPRTRRFGLTSVSENVARHASVPVALVNSPRTVEAIVRRLV